MKHGYDGLLTAGRSSPRERKNAAWFSGFEKHAAFGVRWRRLERLEKAGGRDAFWFLFGPM
jgi:hypothetical protein